MVEVHGNGPFTLPAVLVQHVPVVLKAAPGYRPQFVAAMRGEKDHNWLDLRAGAVLEGCDFRAAKWPVVLSGTGAWEVRNCRFHTTAVGHFCWHGGPSLEFTDCLLFCTGLTIFDLAAKDQVELTNNVIIAAPWPKGILCFSAPGGQSVTCTNNTMVCLDQEGMFLPQAGCTQPIAVEATGNIFQGGRVVPDGRQATASAGRAGTTCTSGLKSTAPPEQTEIGGRPTSPPGTSPWACRGSLAADGACLLPARCALRELPATESLPLVQALAKRMLKEGGVSTEAGPDWNLVGPGEAYVRALAAEKASKQPESGSSASRLPRLRPAPPSGGPFVLIRAGNEERGFVGLQEALYAASNTGDVIEVRTDGPFPGGSYPDRKRDMP